MSKLVKARLKKRLNGAEGQKRIEIRFATPADRELVLKASDAAGLSMNAWIVRVAKAAALGDFKV